MKETLTIQSNQYAPAHPKHKFKGYTIRQIEYRRAIVSLKKEFYKERLVYNYKMLVSDSPLKALQSRKKKDKERKGGAATSIFSKMLRSLDVLDYAVMGISIYNSVSNFVSVFKRKKKEK